ncbi:MAG: DUF1059 domain-containing protein [Candidatus Micrarchaeaceae archaeon]
MKSFACADIGMSCGFTATDNDMNKLMKKIQDHARKAHGMKTIDAATMAKIQAAIKDV